VGYIDAEYAELDDSVASVGITDDNELPQTPEWSANVGIAYTGQVGSWTITPRVDWAYTDEVHNNAVNTPQLIQDSYSLYNAAITVLSEDEKWEFMLAGRNLGDETILVAGSSGYITASGYTAANYAREREWSFSAKYSF
jgi:iron complex outermembrane receptor protein